MRQRVPFLLAVLVIACSGDSGGPGAGENGGPKVRPVVTVRPTLEALDDTFLEREATLFPVAEATVSTRQGGFIARVLPEVGDVLHAGDLIAELDPKQVRLRLAEQRATLDKSRTTLSVEERNWQRVLELHQSRVASEEQRDEQKGRLDRARAEVAEVQARLDREQQNLNDLTITAPLPGVVSRLYVENGEYLQRGRPIVDLKRIDGIVALCTVSERFLTEVHEGAPATVQVTAFPDRRFQGLVWKVVGDAVVESRSFPVKVLLSNPDLLLKPGMSSRVSFTRHLDDALLVPKDAVVNDGDERVVFVVKDGAAERRVVELGAAMGHRWHVRSGLRPDELVIVTGNEDLEGGDAVKLVELPPPGPPTVPKPTQADQADATES